MRYATWKNIAIDDLHEGDFVRVDSHDYVTHWTGILGQRSDTHLILLVEHDMFIELEIAIHYVAVLSDKETMEERVANLQAI